MADTAVHVIYKDGHDEWRKFTTSGNYDKDAEAARALFSGPNVDFVSTPYDLTDERVPKTLT